MANWELKHCCNHEQKIFLIFLGVCCVIAILIGRWLAPLRFIYVFLHEASHAINCLYPHLWLYGSGQTSVSEGEGWFILPAGYLGTSFWGMILTLASTNLLFTRIAAGCLVISLIVALFVAKDCAYRTVGIGHIIFLVVFWVLQETKKIAILRYIILLLDIYEKLVFHKVDASDAEQCAELYPCCNGPCWGVIWGFISLLFSGASTYFAR